MRALVLAALVVLAAALGGCKSDGTDKPKLALVDTPDPITTGSVPMAFSVEPGVEAWYRERGSVVPLGSRPAYCHGFGCEFRAVIPLDDDDEAALARIFQAHGGSPAAERVAVDLADQWWEKRADREIGAPPDKRGSDLADAHHAGQTDCIDEATNTTTLLLHLEQRGLLRFHHVQRPESRGAFLYAHATAVMRDRTTGTDWIADSWMRDSGDPIDVMPLEEWFSRAYVDPVS
ncbi:hypothetical protein EYW49_18515 [Siculibacillus lacustris]|uniref:Lipoprotein n=1 Tax=Siculibacillus lacustris TaxID=1549641 RepID=A0A4Q9VGU8_9HYPH|nr:hypothetical protein [Siculibacillus lacustris]TBW34280.1 hypothetical protein EYW49_18515 [Siculibacillus lacustris]